MKTGTVRWFNPVKGYGYIHPDDGTPNVVVHGSAVESAGLSGLEDGQRVGFEIQPSERTGDMTAVSLKTLTPVTSREVERAQSPTNPFDAISAFVFSAMSPLLLR